MMDPYLKGFAHTARVDTHLELAFYWRGNLTVKTWIS